MNVFLLLLQEVITDGVEGVGAKLVVAEQHEEEVEGDASFKVHLESWKNS
jgi:hypothetical protein